MFGEGISIAGIGSDVVDDQDLDLEGRRRQRKESYVRVEGMERIV